MSQDKLLPVDWAAIEPHYRAGIRSYKSIGTEFGVSAQAIHKHFSKLGIKRDLKARIHAAAQELVDAQAVDGSVDAAGVNRRERTIVDINANILAAVQIAHRKDIARGRALSSTLLADLEDTTERPELFAQVQLVLDEPDEPALEALRETLRLVANLPQRVALLKSLAETMGRFIGMEREAFGLDTAAGTDGRPLVIIKDYCGRGDLDSPIGAPTEPSTAETKRLEEALRLAAELGEDTSVLRTKR